MPVEGAWADHLGGRILPEARGPLSAEWRALLAGESPAGIGAKAGAGLAPQERLLQPMMYGALMENAHNGGAHRPLRPWYRCTHAGVLLHASFLAAAAAKKAASSHHSRARIALPSSVSLEGPIADSKSPWLASWRALSAMYSSIIPSNKGKSLRCAGLWSGAFQRDPRPVFFATMYGVRAAVPARPLAMKALGMWDWEVCLWSLIWRDRHSHFCQ